MKLYVDIDTGELRRSLTGPVFTGLVFHLRDIVPMEIVFTQAGAEVTSTVLPTNTVMKLGLKAALNSTTLLAGTSTYTLSGQIASATFSLNTAEAIAYFESSVPQGARDATLCFEIRVIAANASTRVVNHQSAVTVRRDVFQPSDEDPVSSAAFAGQAEAARDAAVIAQTAAELAETHAETAETNAETAQTAAELAETHAETAETNAETAQGLAEAARDAAVIAQTAAELAETHAETAETNAETAQGLAQTAQTAAELAETHAETAETNAQTAQGLAEDARDAAQGYRDTASTKATEAAASAAAALVSQGAAATSASAASASASSASSSATTALNAIISAFKGGVAGASVPATSTAAGDYYRITAAGTSQSKTWTIGDLAVYNGTSGSWTQIPAGFVDEARLLKGDSTRAIRASLYDDGATAARRPEWTPGAAGAFAGLPVSLLSERSIPTANPSAKSYLFASCGVGTSDPAGQNNSLTGYWGTSGELVIDQAGATAGTDYRRKTYTGARAALAALYGTRPVKIVAVFASPNTTTDPLIYAEGIDITASFGATTTGGSNPNWVHPSLDTTKWLGGYNNAAGRFIPHGPILGALTAAEVLEWTQTGRLPNWCEVGTGSAVNRITGDSYNFAGGVGLWAKTFGATITADAGNAELDVSLSAINEYAQYTNGAAFLGAGYKYRWSVTIRNWSGTGTLRFMTAGGNQTIADITAAGTYSYEFLCTAVSTGVLLYKTNAGALAFSVYQPSFTNLGPIIKPVIVPGCSVLTDSGDNRSPGLSTAGVTALGEKPEIIAIPIPAMTADGFIIADQAIVPIGYEPYACSIERTAGASTGTITIKKTSSGGTTLFTGTLAATVSLTATIIPFATADKLHLANSSWSSSTLRGRVLCRRALN